MAAERPDLTPGAAIIPRNGRGQWIAGHSANPGGRPKRLAEIDRMLDEEHRGLDHMRAVFGRLRALALGELITVMDEKGETSVVLTADPAFMKMYLDRVLGPVRARDDELDSAVESKLMELIAEAKRQRGQAP